MTMSSPSPPYDDRTGTPSELPLPAYRAAIALDEPFQPSAGPVPADRLDERVRAALRLLSTDPAVSRLGLRAGSCGTSSSPTRRPAVGSCAPC